MYGPVCEVRMAFSRGKVLFFWNESALSVIILLVLSCCLVRKHGKDVTLSRLFLIVGWVHVRVHV